MLHQSMKENDKSENIHITDNKTDKTQKSKSVNKLREDDSKKSSLRKVSFKNGGRPLPV